MKEYDLNRLLTSPEVVYEKINSFLTDQTIIKGPISSEEIKGHLLKAENNLRFVQENIRLNFIDWAITGCYYASYHAALSLILTKGYSSKNHLATLCVLVKEFYKNGLDKDDFQMLASFLDYEDVLFYVESKNKREDATYSTQMLFEKKEAEQLRIKAALFVAKIRGILKD